MAMGKIIQVTEITPGGGNGISTWLPDPKRGGLTVTIQDLDASTTGRNQKGQLFRDRVAVKRKISYSAPPLTNAEISTLLKAISSQFFYLTYPDPQTGGREKITAYCGDRTAPMYSCINGVYKWEGLTVDFIER